MFKFSLYCYRANGQYFDTLRYMRHLDRLPHFSIVLTHEAANCGKLLLKKMRKDRNTMYQFRGKAHYELLTVKHKALVCALMQTVDSTGNPCRHQTLSGVHSTCL